MADEFGGYISNYLLGKHLDRLYELSLDMKSSPHKIYDCLLTSLDGLSYNIYYNSTGFAQRISVCLSEVLNLYALYRFKQDGAKKLDFDINWIENERVENIRMNEDNLFALIKSILNGNDDCVFYNIMILMLRFDIELQDILDIEEMGCFWEG